LFYVPVILAFCGCGSGVTGVGPGTGGAGGTLTVAFDSSGGNYAVAKDEQDNEYTFRAREDESGETIITEANVKTSDGTTLKASLDSEGRPVNFRMSDNTAADLVYTDEGVNIRLTDENGSLIEGEPAVNYELAKERVRARRAAIRSKDSVRMQQSESGKPAELRRGLERFEEVVESICDENENPDSPLATNARARELKESAIRLAGVASTFGLDEVERDELGDDVTLDEVPEVVGRLAGNTYILFDAEGFCIELTGVANRLTFDMAGILQSEFDRHLVFPDFSLGGGGEPGITINYSTGTPINMAPGEEADFELVLTPVFTGTQLDDNNHVTIERRFHGDLTFDVDLFGVTEASAEKLFDAAFINGFVSEDGALVEFDLVLVDLQDENPAVQLGRLRYHDQNSLPPERIFTCEVITGEDVTSGIVCPGSVAEGEDFTVEYLFGRNQDEGSLDFDWFISDGFGFLLAAPFQPSTTVRATAEGFLEMSLIVSDLSGSEQVFGVYTCGINVGRGGVGDEPPPDGLSMECPPGLNVGEPGYFCVRGSMVPELNYPDWFVFGTGDFFLATEDEEYEQVQPRYPSGASDVVSVASTDPFVHDAIAEFYREGRYEVAFQAYDSTGHEVFASCEVFVGGLGFDECEMNRWYGDGVCDEFCPHPDPDCELFHDICEINGWYGDGECDDFCPYPDPDCEGDFFDMCAENGWYGDGECDLFCPMPDPDCDVEFYDICFENGWYDDGECDTICPHPDPDCEGEFFDICEVNGWYGDGECDEFCPRPDPDCDSFDVCFDNGWYGDGECDLFCPSPDPDCKDFDECAENGWYGDGVCDPYCLEPDPDCDFFDICEENGWYGDGECDVFCPQPDPDCESTDICEENGWYGDGKCDEICLHPDPDCDFVDICEENGWYGDGECDEFCPAPDPDCEVAVDICEENGWYGDGECDTFCPEPDPDCESADICEENGWYGDGECDTFCPQPDPDCESVDICEENGWYGDGECDTFCPQPDPDCESVDICAENGWYGDGECDTFCPHPDPDCESADICEVNGWYGDGECDTFCPQPDPDCNP